MRYALVLVILAVVALPFAVRMAVVPAELPTLASFVKTERLIVITPHTSDIRNEFAHAFSTWHRVRYDSDVVLDFRTPGGTSDIKRQLDATYRAYREHNSGEGSATDISVVWGGGDFFMDQELKPLGVLQPISMPPALAKEFTDAFQSPDLAGVKLYEATRDSHGTPTPQWIGVCLSSFGICYNPDVYRSLNLPEPSPNHGWTDLTEPRLSGWIALADPAHSGSSAVAYQMVLQHHMALAESAVFDSHPEIKALPVAARSKDPVYKQAIEQGWKDGMRELVLIAANARYFTDSSPLVPMDVSRGEAAVGMAIDFYARITQESVGPDRIAYIAPIGATAITPDPVAILAGTTGRNLELSLHLIEYLLSTDGQRLWALKAKTSGGPLGRSLRRMPIRRSVYADRTSWSDDMDPFASAAGFNQRGAWMALFSDTRPIWVAAWIDSREALQSAYAAVLRVSDDNRRRQLLAELSDIPITMHDVEQIRAERKRLESPNAVGDLNQWRAVQQIDWARRFREHYDAVQQKAR